MIYLPSQTFGEPFTLSDASRALADPDAGALPACHLFRNGTWDTGVTLAVAKVSTGKYRVSGTVPSGYAAGDVLKAEIQPVTIGGTLTLPAYLPIGQVETVRVSSLPILAAIVAALPSLAAIVSGVGSSSGGATADAIAAAIGSRLIVPRSQDDVTAPTWDDAVYGSWVQAFGAEDVNDSARTYDRYDWRMVRARGFVTTTADLGGYVVTTGRH